MPLKVSLISLGCARNLVDSEVMLGILRKSGYAVCGSPESSDVAIVNTCSFIEDAKKESVEAILDLIDLKKRKRIRAIVVAGCLPQRYGRDLIDELGEIDAFIGVEGFEKLPGILEKITGGAKVREIVRSPRYIYGAATPRLRLTAKHFAYIKVSEGCSHKCSFCVIPDIRGRHRSRGIPSIIREARRLIKDGVKEINLIGQDTTLYGIDIYRKPKLAELLKKLSDIRGARWIRLLYTHPAHFNDGLISVIAAQDAICKYIDLPIQHISGRILKAMRRGTTKASIAALIVKLRGRVSGIAIRTAVIVGFPGETEREFGELADFIKEIKFERLGAFIYSREEGTAAARFKGQIPEREKKARWDEIMKIQRAVSAEKNSGLIGRDFEVLIDEKAQGEKDLYIGRTYMDAPEIDGSVYVRGKGIKAGDFVKARIIDAYEYDLTAERP